MHNPRTVFGGAGLALALGLMLGGAMHPNLAGDDRPAGPQIILGKGALRSTGPFDPGPASVSYTGQVPDYVTGTDWKRAAALPDETAAAPERAHRIAREEDPPAVIRTDYDAEPPLPPPPRILLPRHGRDYPSLGRDDPAFDRDDPRWDRDRPRHAPVGQAVDDADEEPDSAG